MLENQSALIKNPVDYRIKSYKEFGLVRLMQYN